MTKEKMTPDPVTAGEVVEHLRAQVNDLAAQLDHSRMANRGWREQMQETQVTMSKMQQALGQANARIKELEVEIEEGAAAERAYAAEDHEPEEPSDEV